MSPVPERRRYRVAFLAGDGVGPELVAEASRAVAAVGQLHGFRVLETHAPFGGDAVRRCGSPAACRDARGMPRAPTPCWSRRRRKPALEGVKASLDLTWRLQRVVADGADLAIVSPLVADAAAWTVARAFAIARERRAHVVSVGASSAWEELVRAEADRHAGVIVERLALEEALPQLAHAPDRIDVVVTEESVRGGALGDGGLDERAPAVVASGRLAERGPGVFGPTHGSAPELAGQGVANPSGILLAAAIMLGEGLGERVAARTLDNAVAEALAAGALTPDMLESGPGSTTRQFMDVLLAELPGARRDHEFAVEMR